MAAISKFISHTHTTQPFYGSVEFVRENPGEPVPDKFISDDTYLR